MTGSSQFEWQDFQLGFWHPFGPYTNLSETEILKWKSDEVERHGWTFWSFAYSRGDKWLDQLKGLNHPIHVWCSDSPKARDPDLYQGQRHALEYRELDSNAWQPMPDPSMMKVTNPFKRSELALAFEVKKVFQLDHFDAPPVAVEWFAKAENRWREDSIPTRGEFLIRRGGKRLARRVRAVLELMSPYLAELRPENTMLTRPSK